MRGYKIVARILLMLSVINFALTAPVVVWEHQARAIESNDGAGPSNAAPPIDSPSPLPGPAQSHSLVADPSSSQDVYTSPVPTSQAPPDEAHPSPLAHGQGLADDSQEPNPSSRLDSLTYDNHDLDLNSAPPSALRFKYLSDLVPTDGTPHPPGSPQISSSPDSLQTMPLPDEPSSSSLVSQYHAIPPPTSPWSSQAQVPPPPDLPWQWSRPTRPQLNLPWQWSSRTRTRVPPPQSPDDHLSTEESHPSSPEQWMVADQYPSWLDQSVKSEPHLPIMSTDNGHSPIPGPTDKHPQPASPSNPGPSTQPNPPPSAEPMHPEEHEIWGSLGDILKGKIKRDYSVSGSFECGARGTCGYL